MHMPPTLVCLALLVPGLAFAQLPEPLDPAFHAFPGATRNPPSGVSAGVALADLWLGDEPYHNPAIPASRALRVTPLFQRLSRQDLRARYRRFDEQPGFFDAGGLALTLPAGALGIALYAHQPVLRHEDNAFERGQIGDPTPPAVIRTATTMREARLGLAVSAGAGTARFGGAVEWTERRDDYEFHEQSGSPDAGDRVASFSGGGLGFQGGLRWQSPEVMGGPLSIGVAARWIPELTVTGDETIATTLRDTASTFAAMLQSGVECGVSLGHTPWPAVGLVAGVGYRSEREWRGFGVRTGSGTVWSLGFEYHDAEEPWTFRAGYGQERSADDPEPRYSMLGLGVSWAWEGWGLDLGVLHRTFEREPHPTAVDDRVVATLRFDL